MTGANRSWCQKVGQMSRVFQVQATGRFEVEDFAKHILLRGKISPMTQIMEERAIVFATTFLILTYFSDLQRYIPCFGHL
jgi:hypothetical protein